MAKFDHRLLDLRTDFHHRLTLNLVKFVLNFLVYLTELCHCLALCVVEISNRLLRHQTGVLIVWNLPCQKFFSASSLANVLLELEPFIGDFLSSQLSGVWPIIAGARSITLEYYFCILVGTGPVRRPLLLLRTVYGFEGTL